MVADHQGGRDQGAVTRKRETSVASVFAIECLIVQCLDVALHQTANILAGIVIPTPPAACVRCRAPGRRALRPLRALHSPIPALPAPRRAWHGMQPPIPKTCVECGSALSTKQRKFCSDACSVLSRAETATGGPIRLAEVGARSPN